MYLLRCLLHKSYFSLYAWITRQLIDNSYIEPPQNQNNAVSYSDTDENNKIHKAYYFYCYYYSSIIIFTIITIITIIISVTAFVLDNITLIFNNKSFNSNLTLIFRRFILWYIYALSLSLVLINW